MENKITMGQPKCFILPPKCCASLHSSFCHTFILFPLQSQFLDKQTKMSLGDKTAESLVLNTGSVLWLSSPCQGSPLSPAVHAGKAACGCGWRRQHSWGSDAHKDIDAVFSTAHVSKRNSGSVGIVLWPCRCHQCTQQLHVCFVDVSKCCSSAAGPSFEEAELTARNKVPFLCSTCSVLLKT